jgi:hypothetical protein
MQISPKQIRLLLLALTAFSMTKAEVSADILPNKTPGQTNSEESLRDSTADPGTDSVDLIYARSSSDAPNEQSASCRLTLGAE